MIVHELLHLRVPNHGKLFKSLMRAHLGEWEAMRLDLNECKQLEAWKTNTPSLC